MSPRERACLKVLAGYDPGYGVYFSTIASAAGLTVAQTRRAVRSLARKGLAVHERGLFSESTGMLVGSGYGITPNGRSAAAEAPK